MADTAPYMFAPTFEREVLRHLMLTDSFWAAIGPHMESDAFSPGIVQTVAQAICVLGEELGRAPGSGTIVVERVARWREMGRVTHEQVLEADDFVGSLEDMPASDHALILSQLAPTIRLRKQQENLKTMMTQVSSRQDQLDDLGKLILDTNSLGVLRVSEGIRSDEHDVEKLRASASVRRMPLGISDLDSLLMGGPKSKTATVFMGSTGDGKSMALCQTAATCYLNGLNVFVATLELSEEVWYTRFVSNITGVPIDNIVPSDRLDDAIRIFRSFDKAGYIEVHTYTAHVTKYRTILNDLEEAERRQGKKFDVLIVDYADLVGFTATRAYEGMREVYAGFRSEFAVARDAWFFTASASKRRSKANEKQSIEDGADSQHKARLSDLWIILTYNKESGMVDYEIGKNRYGGGLGTVITIPAEFECARIVPEASRTRCIDGKCVYTSCVQNDDADLLPF